MSILSWLLYRIWYSLMCAVNYCTTRKVRCVRLWSHWFHIDPTLIPHLGISHVLALGMLLDPSLSKESILWLPFVYDLYILQKKLIPNTDPLEFFFINSHLDIHAHITYLCMHRFIISCFKIQVLKKKGYDEACDVWSLGVLVYTMLSGWVFGRYGWTWPTHVKIWSNNLM